MTDSKNVRPCPKAAVASTSLRAIAACWRSLTRKPAEHALVEALEDALAVGRLADVLHGRRAGNDLEAGLHAGPHRRVAHERGPGVIADRRHERDRGLGRAAGGARAPRR